MQRVFRYLLIFTPPMWLAVFFLLPLLYIFVYSFGSIVDAVTIEYTFSLHNYFKIFDDIYLQIFFKSIGIALLTTAICLVVGLAMALYISFQNNQTYKMLFVALVILPFWTNLLIRTYALIAVFRTNGVVNTALESMYSASTAILDFFHIQPTILLGEEFTPLELLYNNTAVVIGLVYVHLPFMVLPLYAALDKLDKSYIEASFDLGANTLQTMIRVVIPSIKFGIFSGIIITFIPALGSFLTPDLLGGNDSQMIANVIERQFKSANNIPFGSALSLVLIYIMIAVMAFEYFYTRRDKKRKAENA